MESIPSKLDIKGFLRSRIVWDLAVAHQIALEEGLDGLDDECLKIIEVLRRYHDGYAMLPMLRRACKTFKDKDLPLR